MFEKLMRLFEVPEDSVSDDELRLAGAVLLVEVAMADHSFRSDEERQLLCLLQKQFALSTAEGHELLRLARESAAKEVSLHHHLDIINANYDAGQKIDLMRTLWDVAYADGELHHYEEHLIRRLGDLLYVSHRDFIRTKYQAAGNMDK